MQGEKENPADKIVGQIHEFKNRFYADAEFSRRTILKGLGALITLTTLQGLSAIEILNNRETLDITAGDICPDQDISCYLQPTDLDVPAVVSPTPAETTPPTSPPETTLPPTTVPPPPETTIPPTTVAPPPVMKASSAVEMLPTPTKRRMSYERFVQNAEQYFAVLPTLDTLHAIFPGSAFYNFIPEQRQHIENLRQAVQPTSEKYAAFGFNTDFSRLFNQTGGLDPKAFIWHWTGWDFTSPADLTGMSPNSVQIYIHKDAVAYQMVPNLDVIAGHARTMNPFSWGMEMYSGHYDGVHSPLFSFTPEMVETGVYVAVNRLRSRNLPVNRLTLLGHATADLIFMNPYYDPATGTFHEIPGRKPITIHKFDPPQEFMEMVILKAVELDQLLGPR